MSTSIFMLVLNILCVIKFMTSICVLEASR